MDFIIENRRKLLQHAAMADKDYKRCYDAFLEAERIFLEMIPNLTETQQDVIWQFVNLSNEVDQRLLEITCQYRAL